MLNFKFSIMRHYFTSKLFLFLFVLFGCVMATNGQSLKTVKNWNFLSWSETTLANLGADATSWEAEIDAETQVLKRYKNLETVDAKNVLKANGVVIAETDGILFPALTKGNLSLRINMGDDGIQLGSKNLEVTIKELKAGQHVTIILKSANATSGRGISAITNMTGTVGSDTYKTGNDGENTYELVVAADGDVKFKYNEGVILKSITVSEETVARKVAYIYDSSYAGYVLDEDPVHAALIDAYEVTDIDVKSLDGSTVNELLGYDLVFSSEAVGGKHAYGLKLETVVNKVPMLNLKSFYYSSDRWAWATGQNPDKGTNTMIILEAYRNHAIFNGVAIAEDGTCVIFTESDASNNQVQAYKDPGAIIADDIVMAKDGTGTYNTIHEHGTTNKYMLIPFASNLIRGIDANAIRLLLNAADYLIATKEVYVEPSDPVAAPVISDVVNGNAKTVTITTATEDAAIYYTLDGTVPTIESILYTQPFDVLKPCSVTAFAVKEGMLDSEIVSKDIENENYIARNKTLLWANFKDQPEEWGVTGDIIGSGKTDEKTIAGFIIGSKGQRVNLQATGVSEKIGDTYGPATEEDMGATSYAMSFLTGSASGYIITPSVVAGPFDVAIWWCTAKSASYTEKLTISVKTADAEEWTELETISNKSYKSVRKQIVSYDGTEPVQVKITCASGNGSNNNAMIFDVKLLGEGADPVATPVISAEANGNAKTVTITTDTKDATIYYTINGTDPTIASTQYTEPFDILKPCTVKAFAVKKDMADSDIASEDIENENYIARNKTLLWANFKNQPEEWGITGDIIASGKTDEKTVAGFIIGSEGQRVNLQTTGVSEEIGGNYGPETEADTGASGYAMSFLTGTASAYMITPSAVAGPFDIAIWWCGAKSASNTEKLTVSVKTVDAEEWTELGTLSNDAYKNIRKQVVSYEGTEPVLVKFASASENGKNNNAMIFDIKLLGEGEDPVLPVATPVITTEDTADGKMVTIACEIEDAAVYYTLDGTEPTVESSLYAEPFETKSSCTVKAIAVKEGFPDSEIAELDITIATSIISETASKVILSRSYFTVGGVKLEAPVKGLNIVRTVFEDGVIEMSKVIVE